MPFLASGSITLVSIPTEIVASSCCAPADCASPTGICEKFGRFATTIFAFGAFARTLVRSVFMSVANAPISVEMKLVTWAVVAPPADRHAAALVIPFVSLPPAKIVTSVSVPVRFGSSAVMKSAGYASTPCVRGAHWSAEPTGPYALTVARMSGPITAPEIPRSLSVTVVDELVKSLTRSGTYPVPPGQVGTATVGGFAHGTLAP